MFDFDEAQPGWAADDIALATRELRGDESRLARPELFDRLRRASAWHRRAVLDASAGLQP